jgi:RimJ/RimL family protein N-acetyltransferase
MREEESKAKEDDMIQGDRVVLTALDRKNAETVRAWINDPSVHRYMLSGHVPITAESELAYYDESEASPAIYNFEIHVAEDMRLIGHCGLIGVDLRHRRGEVGIMIGDLSAQNQGYGRDAIVTLLRFAFDTLGLNAVTIGAREDNERGLHLYRSIGFKDAGRTRDTDYAEGRFWDLVILDMLVGEFRELYPA